MLRTDLSAHPVWLAVVSTGRPQAVKAYEDTVGPATWYVKPGEVKAYHDAGAASVHTSDGLCEARNAALDHAHSRKLACVQMSDDIKGFIQAVPTEECTAEFHRYRRETVTLADVVTDLWETSVSVNARLVGVSATDSLIFYNHLRPTSLSSFVLGDFMYIAPSSPRFDTELTLKEDYDFTAQHLLWYGVAARRNQWILKAQHRTNAGGAVARRTLELEARNIVHLQNKWGEDIMRLNPRKPGEILFRWPKVDLSLRQSN